MGQSEKPLGFLLFLVSRAHHNCADRVFGQYGLHRGQPTVLIELGKQDGLTQSELAEKVEVTPATLTNMLRRMETTGLIFRERDAVDTRISRVFLSETGKKIQSQVKQSAVAIETTAFAGFSEEERLQMTGFLNRIHTNLTC